MRDSLDDDDKMYSICIIAVMKEFGEGNGVIYVDTPEDVMKKAIELVEKGTLKEYGLNARKFVEGYNWDDIVDEFEGVLEELA